MSQGGFLISPAGPDQQAVSSEQVEQLIPPDHQRMPAQKVVQFPGAKAGMMPSYLSHTLKQLSVLLLTQHVPLLLLIVSLTTDTEIPTGAGIGQVFFPDNPRRGFFTSMP